MRLKLSTRKEYCHSVADRIHKANPTLLQIEKAISDVYDIAYARGYDDKGIDDKKMRNSKESLLRKRFNDLMDVIDDKINECK